MQELIKKFIARRLGLLTGEEHMKLVRSHIEEFRDRARHAAGARENDRLQLVEKITRLETSLRDAEEHITFLQSIKSVTKPTTNHVGDF